VVVVYKTRKRDQRYPYDTLVSVAEEESDDDLLDLLIFCTDAKSLSLAVHDMHQFLQSSHRQQSTSCSRQLVYRSVAFMSAVTLLCQVADSVFYLLCRAEMHVT